MEVFAQDLSGVSVDHGPFPHGVVDGLFTPGLFGRLADSYPVCPPASGPTGRTIHRGDAQFDAVMAAHEPWRDLFAACNSPPFLDMISGLFEAEIARSCAVARGDLRLVDYIETRAEKEEHRIGRPAYPARDMFVRFDFMQGMASYSRAAHLDHRRRLATMLIYFDAPGPDSFTGGDLVLHDARGVPVTRIASAPNRAVLFPCSERSWHSVEAVSACTTPRRFVQIAVSSCHNIWPGAPLAYRAKQRLRHLLGV